MRDNNDKNNNLHNINNDRPYSLVAVVVMV